MAVTVSVRERNADGKGSGRPRGRAGWRRFRANGVAVVSAVFLLLMYAVAATGPAISPYSPNAVDIANTNAPPSPAHWLGTDESGRDVLARVIAGARTSMTVGLIAMVLAIAIGALVGSLAGYLGGWVDTVLMRFTDGMLAIPYFFLVLIVVAVFGSRFWNIVGSIGLISWMVVARIVRGEVLRYRGLDFVLAAQGLGATSARILGRHIIPQTVPSLIVAATFGVANAILLESALSYLGLGIQPPQASWGNMLSNAQAYVWENPLLPIYPGLLIVCTVLAYNFLGDALRDALDPRYRESDV
ncbi:MAG TPA: ABC transporter permease [bacterium]|nr:ABC transporter permease [bacterium]